MVVLFGGLVFFFFFFFFFFLYSIHTRVKIDSNAARKYLEVHLTLFPSGVGDRRVCSSVR